MGKGSSIWVSIVFVFRFKWSNLVEQLTYEKNIEEQRLRVELGQARREAKHFVDQVQKGAEIRELEKKVSEGDDIMLITFITLYTFISGDWEGWSLGEETKEGGPCKQSDQTEEGQKDSSKRKRRRSVVGHDLQLTNGDRGQLKYNLFETIADFIVIAELNRNLIFLFFISLR